jgi:hypothetical protein
MTSFSAKIATARRAALATVLGATVAATVLGLAGAAHADDSILDFSDFSDSSHLPHGCGPDSMYGCPQRAAQHWARQHEGDDCGEMAVAMVVGQITGHAPSEQEVLDVAEHTPSTKVPGPIYDHKGTWMDDLPVLLKHYHILNPKLDNPSMSDLEQDLGHMEGVIAFVNGPTIWNSPGDRTKMDHFVVVTGVDTNAGVVHLNDSGVDNGRDEQVPIATFEAAWAPSKHGAVRMLPVEVRY